MLFVSEIPTPSAAIDRPPAHAQELIFSDALYGDYLFKTVHENCAAICTEVAGSTKCLGNPVKRHGLELERFTLAMTCHPKAVLIKRAGCHHFKVLQHLFYATRVRFASFAVKANLSHTSAFRAFWIVNKLKIVNKLTISTPKTLFVQAPGTVTDLALFFAFAVAFIALTRAIARVTFVVAFTRASFACNRKPSEHSSLAATVAKCARPRTSSTTPCT